MNTNFKNQEKRNLKAECLGIYYRIEKSKEDGFFNSRDYSFFNNFSKEAWEHFCLATGIYNPMKKDRRLVAKSNINKYFSKNYEKINEFRYV